MKLLLFRVLLTAVCQQELQQNCFHPRCAAVAAGVCQQEFQQNCIHPHCAAAAAVAAALKEAVVVVELVKLQLTPGCSAMFLDSTIGWLTLFCSSAMLQMRGRTLLPQAAARPGQDW